MEPIQSKAAQGRVADAPNGHWVYRVLPRSIWPYAQLARWDRPIGWQLLLWPCWWSAALAASAYPRPGDPLLSLLPAPLYLVLFLVGAIAMRGAGCTYNDIVDENIDNQVERTRSRPLPSGQTTRRRAWLFLVLQALVGLVVLLQFNSFAILLGVCSLAIVAIYPFMKRITNWPLLFLGLAFSWGALMGWAVEFGDLDGPAIMLYIGSILWVIGYDTIYAHQDREDDALIGIKSTALLFGERTKPVLALFYAIAVVLIAAAGVTAGAGAIFGFGLLAFAAHLAWQVFRLDIGDPDRCLAVFKSDRHAGLILFAGLLADAALRRFV
jgi:4-hydroxybenzoate polyprenyltransferase